MRENILLATWHMLTITDITFYSDEPSSELEQREAFVLHLVLESELVTQREYM